MEVASLPVKEMSVFYGIRLNYSRWLFECFVTVGLSVS